MFVHGDCSWVKFLIDDTPRHFDAEEEGVCAENRSLALSGAFRNIGHSLSSSEILDRGKPNQQRRRGGGNRTTKRPSKFLDTKNIVDVQAKNGRSPSCPSCQTPARPPLAWRKILAWTSDLRGLDRAPNSSRQNYGLRLRRRPILWRPGQSRSGSSVASMVDRCSGQRI